MLVTAGGQDHAISGDPNGAKVVGQIVEDDTWIYWATNIRSRLMIGDVGDKIMEIFSCLGIVLVLSGVYPWWPRGKRTFKQASAQREIQGARPAILEGIALSGGLVVRTHPTWLSRLWSRLDGRLGSADRAGLEYVFGRQMGQCSALRQDPCCHEAGTLGARTNTDAGINGWDAGHAARMAVNLDTVAELARKIGFYGQFRINVPTDTEGVYTVSADSMDGDQPHERAT